MFDMVIPVFQITHGFDSTGVLFDGEGTFNPLTSIDFNDAAACLKKQYSSEYWEAAGTNVRFLDLEPLTQMCYHILYATFHARCSKCPCVY